ncbi:MAG: DNA mismatch repair protein MutS [Chloroflexi bacterium]|nr:DNA mismatch repair protein MutS [Chloroflexota bacterium]
MAKPLTLSPGRRQYLELKREHHDALLLVRMGDFFEAFDEDARTLARVLDITLTSRDVGGGVRAPLAGIPHHAIEAYLGRLVAAGLKVAVAEQTSDPAASKGLVDRAIVRILTPGTVLEPGLLDERRNNYLAAVVASDGTAGIAYVDITTSEFVAGELPGDAVRDELDRIGPAEVLAGRGAEELISVSGAPWTVRQLPPGRQDARLAADALKRHFGLASLARFGVDDRPLAVIAAAAVLDFLTETQRGNLPQITSLRPLAPGDHMVLDRRALRDLEILEPLSGKKDAPTLLGSIDRTRAPMGNRLIRSWVVRPLLKIEHLRARQAGVRFFFDSTPARLAVRDSLGKVPDLERLINRVRAFSATPRDLLGLARGLQQVPVVRAALSIGSPPERYGSPQWLNSGPLRECPDVAGLIQAAIDEDAPADVGDGQAMRKGFDPELDEVRELAADAHSQIAAIEEEARARSGIKTLKVGYNRVFGYYIEVSRSNAGSMPPDFERRQTLVNGERFVTPRLKEYESRVLNARERLSELERSVFRRVCTQIAAQAEAVMASARALAEIDALAALADIAASEGWVMPELDEGDALEIKAGRHPVVERALGPGRFVPNDVSLSCASTQLAIITGPNMSGKSTYIRQVAVLVLLAQMGSYLPAESAHIGVVDRIFTRCGSTDEIARGRSTFLVEMEETATILHQASRRSLVVLDEIGRGTSTYDGLAIAKAVAEHIHSSPRLGCKTLFATHYHEMTGLAAYLPRAVNYQVAVSEEDGDVVFLHRILPGSADRSYGVHVGRLAGLPNPVINRAWELLEQLEKGSTGPASGGSNGTRNSRRPRSVLKDAPAMQLSLISPGAEAIGELIQIDLSSLTPIQALNKLYELQEKARRDQQADAAR